MIDESELSRNLGIDRRTVNGLRDELLVEGEDYVRSKHRKIQITLLGQEKLKAHLFPDQYKPKSLASDQLSGVVTNWQYRNRKIVQVDDKHIVRVKHADLYRPNLWGQSCPIKYKEIAGQYFGEPPDPVWRKTQPRMK